MTNEMKRVLIGTSSFSQLDKSPYEKLLAQGYDIIDNPYKRKLTKVELVELLQDVDGLIAGLEPLTRDVQERSTLKVISRVGSGLSNVDLKAAKELGIHVASTPTGPVQAVVELTIGCLLSLLRKINQMSTDLHNGSWNKQIGRQLSGMEVMVVGLGNIGTRVAELIKSFGANVVGVDPARERNDSVIPLVGLREGLSQADVIILHCSGEEEIIGQDEINEMKEGCLVLNAARGGLINEDSLMQALESGKVSGAWLDAFKEEPYTGKLTNYDQVILTPHIGSYTRECRLSMESEAVDNLIAVLSQK